MHLVGFFIRIYHDAGPLNVKFDFLCVCLINTVNVVQRFKIGHGFRLSLPLQVTKSFRHSALYIQCSCKAPLYN